MKNLVVAVLFLSGLSAQAVELQTINEEVLQSLISKSSQITLLNDGEVMPADQQLPALIASALLQNYGKSRKDGRDTYVVLSMTTVDCKSTTPKGRLGSASYDCSIGINNGDFKDTSGGLVGPDGESGIGFTIKATRGVRPGAKAEVSTGKIETFFAG